jgi:hypothetical protein
MFAVMGQIKDQTPTPPSELVDVPPALNDVLLTAMAAEKEDRYEDVLLLRNALQNLQR